MSIGCLVGHPVGVSSFRINERAALRYEPGQFIADPAYVTLEGGNFFFVIGTILHGWSLSWQGRLATAQVSGHPDIDPSEISVNKPLVACLSPC